MELPITLEAQYPAGNCGTLTLACRPFVGVLDAAGPERSMPQTNAALIIELFSSYPASSITQQSLAESGSSLTNNLGCDRNIRHHRQTAAPELL
jgi:hypothetical protein